LSSGGAFVGGSAKSTIGLATKIGAKVGANALVVETGRYPESTIPDALEAALRAYNWLITQVKTEKIILLGISSGGGIATLLLQNLLTKARPMPSGVVLLGPWLEYTQITRSIRENTIYDYVVNPRVYEFIHPIMGDICGGEDKRREMSPYFGRVKGMCPVHISYSLKEVCVDEDSEFSRRLKEAGVDVEVETNPHLMHAYQLFFDFIPEAASTMESVVSWMKRRLTS